MKNALQRMLAPLGLQLTSTDPERKLFLKDPNFIALYRSIRSHTLVKIDRAFMLYQCARAARAAPGAIAELGVYKGGTAKLLGETCRGTGKKIYLFDTFGGMPWREGDREFTPEREDVFGDITLAAVQEYLREYPDMDYRQGFFPDSAAGLEDERFCLVYLDADLYQSTKAGLEFFWDRLSPGGIVLVDDYGSKFWPGAGAAVDEFAAARHTTPIVSAPFQAMLIKS